MDGLELVPHATALFSRLDAWLSSKQSTLSPRGTSLRPMCPTCDAVGAAGSDLDPPLGKTLRHAPKCDVRSHLHWTRRGNSRGTHIRGPFAVGEATVIKMGTRIYGPTSIGPNCRIGGEVSNCAFLGYSNKGHDGFWATPSSANGATSAPTPIPATSKAITAKCGCGMKRQPPTWIADCSFVAC